MTGGHRGHLADAEKQRRRELGLCLYCGEPGHRREACPILHHEQPTLPRRQPPLPRPRPPPPVPQPPRSCLQRNANSEPLGGRRRFQDRAAESTKPHVEERPHTAVPAFRNPLVDTSALAIRPSARPTKQLVRGQFINGLSTSGGPARLVHGTEQALQALEAATSRDGLVVVEKRSNAATPSPIEAFTTSIEYVKLKGEWPGNIQPLSFAHPPGNGVEAQSLQKLGEPPFLKLNILNALALLSNASMTMARSGGSKTEYQLGIVTETRTGSSHTMRAQLVAPRTLWGAVQSQTRSIWLLRWLESDGKGRYAETWRGFGRPNAQWEPNHLPPHPGTGQMLESDGEGYQLLV